MKKLTKKYMIDKYGHYDKSIYDSKEYFERFLNTIKSEFYNHEFYYDKRYVYIGRQKFLIKEMQELYYSKAELKEHSYDTCPTKWCLDSVLEMIFNNNFLSMHDYACLVNSNDLYMNKSIKECIELYDSYCNDGIISLEERDYILHGINMIQDSLDKCDEKLEWK